ncbi:MAG: hypothetical protein J6P07_05895 [Spirochaetaceae bacterium]|nr:hypothetical protein [Spirochaetaceae bacterium]MBO7731534.1 hypothetical protein [Methanobrevibacter sp.]
MASTILKNLRNSGNVSGQPNGDGDIFSQFMSFKKQIENSGKDPQSILNEMLASGNVPPAMLNKAKTLAAVFANKFKSGR